MVRKCLLFFLVLLSILMSPVLASSAVLWDQPITTTNTTAWTSFFNPNTTWTIYDRYIADDFTNGETWQISTIFIPGSFRSDGQYPFPNASTTYSTLAGATSFKWEIYANSGGVPAGTPQGAGTNPIWELSLTNGDPQVSITNGVDNYPSNVTLTLSTPFNLTAGTYWLVFYPVIDGTIDGNSAGRYGRNISLTTNGFDGQFISTDVVSQTQPIVWTSVQDPYWWALTTQDFAFRLEGTAGTPAPNIAVAPATLAFDPTLVGVTATAKTVTITNNGGAQLNVTNMTITGANASEFAKATGGTCATTYPIPLAAGGSCTQNVTFTPSSVGAKTATLAITSNDGDTPTANVSLTGTGIAPDIAVAPATLAFDPTLVGVTATAKTVTITNNGGAQLNVTNMTITGANASEFAKATGGTCATTYPIPLAAGGSCTQNVTFTPSSVGAKTATLAITSNDGDTPTANVSLTGTGIAPDIAVAPATLAFDPTLVGVTATAKTVTITNNGGAQLNVTNMTITGANASEFAKATGGTCATTYPIPLAAGGSCTQNVTFTPSSVGAKTATLAITSNDGDTPTANVSLTGTGIAPDIAVAPATLAFDPTLVGVTATAKTVTITNNGGAQLNVTNMTITGANASEFAKATGGTCATTYPIPLAAGGSCTQNVTFTPSSVGAKTATLAITSNDGDTPTANVSLTGTGIAPDIAVAPATLAFDPTLVGVTATAKTVTITNNGGAQLNVTNMTITGANASEFAKATGGTCATTYPIPLAAGGSCTQNVTFTPSSVGAKTATLAITSNDGDTPTANVSLTGTGIAPDIDVAPVVLDFDPELVGATSAAKEVTISNTGSAPLNVNSIVISGTNASMFGVATGGLAPCASLSPTIAAGANCTVNVTFTPSSAGAKTATLAITSNDGDTPTANVPLTGTGMQGELSVTEGTIGTEIIINGSGFGESKGKVFIGDVAIKVAKDGWTPTRITCTANKVPLPGETIYDVTIQPKPKGTPVIPLSEAFTVRKPYINPITSDDHGAPEAEVTIRGLWFGTKKGKVYVGEQKCKVKSWDMNPTTGESTIVFVVHKKIGASNYLLEIENKVGRSLTFGFSVP